MLPTTVKITERIALPFWKIHATVPPLSAADLQHRYLSAVLNYVSVRIAAGMDAEDITAEVFTAAFTSLRSCPNRTTTDGDDPVRAWLFGIARRKLADAYRKRTRRPEISLDIAHPAPPQQNPESRALAEEATETLQAIMDALPEIQREVLRLKYLEELSLKEIGWVLGKSPNAVSQLLHRARQTVRERGNDYFGNDITSKEKQR